MSYNKPLSYYTAEENKPLLLFLFEVGEGLMSLLVFPDKTTMLFDCCMTNDSEKYILNFLDNYIPLRYDIDNDTTSKWIDIFVNSHRDEDHYKGLKKVNKKFDIKSIWDSGETGATTQSNDYKYYMYLRRKIKEKYGENAVIIPVPSSNVLASFGGCEIYCLNSSLNYDSRSFFTESNYFEKISNKTLKEAKIQHTNSIVLLNIHQDQFY